jgi:hypothetical protein
VDYINTGGTVSFADGDIAPKIINITLCNDTVYESDEAFYIVLSNPSGAALGSPSSAVIIIINDDTSLQFGSGTFSGAENAAPIGVQVTRVGANAGAVSAVYSFTDGTATGGALCSAGVDYINTGGTVSFATGEYYRSINVPLCNDSVYEGNDTNSDETFNIVLSNPTGGVTLGMPNPAGITIIEDDPTSPITLTVNQIGDVGDGVCDATCTLRDAVTAANNRHVSADTINFDLSVFSTPQTITLLSGELTIRDNVSINGPGANLLSISGNDASRVFYVNSGVTAAFDGITIKDGNLDPYNSYQYYGAGVYNSGTLTVSNSAIIDNFAGSTCGFECDPADGAGIFNSGSLTVINSTVTGTR